MDAKKFSKSHKERKGRMDSSLLPAQPKFFQGITLLIHKWPEILQIEEPKTKGLGKGIWKQKGSKMNQLSHPSEKTTL